MDDISNQILFYKNNLSVVSLISLPEGTQHQKINIKYPDDITSWDLDEVLGRNCN